MSIPSKGEEIGFLYILDSAVETRCRSLIKLKFKENDGKNAIT